MDIIVKNLTKTYGSQKAVDNISFHLKQGEILGFLGPNGAGKTTTMKAISCFIAPTSGEIEVGGYSVKENPDKVKSLLGYLPESNPLYTDMGVIDYLKYVAELQKVPKEKVKSRVAEMIAVCGLEAEKHKIIGELSKGYRQRVGLAQAMIHDPEVLILDEPTTGLDPNQIIEIRELIKRIGREKTVILSSHILAEVEATCDRILIINKGSIVADGSYETLSKKATSSEIIHVGIEGGEFDTVYQALKELPTIAMVDVKSAEENTFDIQSKPDMVSAKAIFDLCVENKWYLSQLTPIETKLEDIFHELTAN
ncbi:MAG: ATP-binding cassette domain-containing protein [Salinivirgaceae bacterium]|nr:ATP-binding cassette domain-containing protein [Salinivirgaceae bacterium]MDD4745856.1 ATP-binding cassette domain-containing protein [Salinivirgaceae bacterium]MDY0280432.1 ATP-binding cassette domain-containing protein [Salinivirgaceae bacterium]